MSTYTYSVRLTETRTRLVPVTIDIGDGDSFDPKYRKMAIDEAIERTQQSPEGWSEPFVVGDAMFWQGVRQP